MKKRFLSLALAALSLALLLAGCEAWDGMFENNMFKDLTHEELSSDSIADSSPEEIAALLESDAYVQQIIENGLVDETIQALEGSYVSMGTIPSAEGQLAALTATELLMMTDENASALSAGVVGAIGTVKELFDTETAPTAADVSSIIESILPASIAASVGAGGEMPAAFADMIDTFTEAQAVFALLGANLDDTSGAATYSAEVDSGQAMSAAVNAVIATAITAVTPTDPEMSTAQAIWNALSYPETADSYIDFDETALDNSTSVLALLEAAGLGGLFN